VIRREDAGAREDSQISSEQWEPEPAGNYARPHRASRLRHPGDVWPVLNPHLASPVARCHGSECRDAHATASTGKRGP
jgi:hypothetical protein